MPIIANTSSANTFSAVRSQLNLVTRRINQFSINESAFYANTITANVSLRLSGTVLANGSSGTSGYYLRTSGTGVYWSPASSTGGGATGGGSDKVFYENDTTITTNYTITTNKNAMTAGPVTINSGITVTVPSGSVWSII
jgi:hypothetical protein